MKKTFCFDIDNTICVTKTNDYKKSKKISSKIETINNLHRKGHHIILFTARYMGRNNNNPIKAKREGYKFTFNQLKKWGLNFDELHMGKPSADYYIDDKSLNYKKNWHQVLKKNFLKKVKV